MGANRKALLLSVLIVTVLEVGGCSRNSGPDPANANLAPVDQNAVAPPEDQYGQPEQAPASSELTVATQPPPPLPQYSQPACPGENYIWTPGYWAYQEAGYYWVPGAWVLAPYVDALWTPPYWAFSEGRYHWNAGYWSRYVGFYGGINYGFGYTGLGYSGGYWNSGAFFYNRSVNNVNVRIVRNVYSHSVTNYTPFNRVSYNGGPRGINRQPSAPELAVRRESRFAPLPAQVTQQRTAGADRAQFAAQNHGRPAMAAAPRPLATSYRAPAPVPHEWQRNEPQHTAPAPETRPSGAREGRGEPPHPQPGAAPQAHPRQAEPMTSPRPEMARPDRGEMRRAAPPSGSADRRQLPAPQQQMQHPARGAEGRPAAQEPKPSPFPHGAAPQGHPQAAPQQHAMPQPRPESRPTPPQPGRGNPPQQRDDGGRGGR